MTTPELVLRRSRLLRLVLALLSGALLAFSFPDASLWLLGFIALTPLILASVFSSSKREAFLLGELALTVTWLINVPWVIHVMSYYGGLSYPTGITLYVAMAFYLAIFGGFFAVLTRMLRPDQHFRSWLIIPLAWCATEYARTYMFTGFPWHLLGGSLVDATWLAIWSSIVGPYALGTMLALSATTIAYLIAVAEPRRRFVALVWTTILIVLIAAGGSLLTARRRATLQGQERHTVALLQPNISQEMRWNNDDLLAIFDRMMKMTEASASRADVVIWPESTVPMTFLTTDFYRDAVLEVSRRHHVDIILGSVAEDPVNPEKIWNTAYLVHDGETKGRYDKMKLVPYGEYVPLRKALFFAKKLVHAVGEFQFGTNDRPLVGKFHYGPAICYEVVFPQLTATQVRHGADVLITITNDAWFGPTAAPYQHLAMARMRAIESDRYLLRAATTGISALVDPTGRIVQQLPYNSGGIIRGEFSARHSLTPYVRFGDWFAVAALAVTLLSLLRRRKALAHE